VRQFAQSIQSHLTADAMQQTDNSDV